MLKELLKKVRDADGFNDAVSLIEKFSETEDEMKEPESFLTKLLELDSLDEIKEKIEMFKSNTGWGLKDELLKIAEKKSVDEIKNAIKDLVARLKKYGYPKYGYPAGYKAGYPAGYKQGYGYPQASKQEETVNIFNQKILKTGNWNGKEWTPDILNEIARNTSNLEDEFKPILKLTHVESPILDKISIGKVKNIRVEGDSLVADFFEVPKRVAEIIRLGSFSGKSAEIYNPYIDRNGKEIGKALRAVAIMGADVPAVKGLDDIKVLYNDEELKGVEIFVLSNETKDEKPKQTGGLQMAEEKLKKIDEIIAENRALKVKSYIEHLKEQGKILPTYEQVVEKVLTATWDNDSKVIKLSENEKEVEMTLKEGIITLLERLPNVIELKEVGTQDEETTEEARQYKEIEKLAEDKKITFTEALKIWKEKQNK